MHELNSPRPAEGRARNYGYQGSLSDGRLGYQVRALKKFLHRAAAVSLVTKGVLHCRGSRTWIVNTRLIQSPIITRMPVSVGVKQVMLFVRLNVSTLRFQVLLDPVPCNKMIHCCEQDNAGRQWSNLFTVTYE